MSKESNGSFTEYAEARMEYVDSLEEAGLLDDQGFLHRGVVAGLGSVGIYGPDSPLNEHCREHPDDPLCWVVDFGRMAEEFLDIRSAYVETLEERGLHGVQSIVTDVASAGAIAGGGTAIPAPGQDPEDYPPGIRPLIRPAELSLGRLPMRVAALF